MISAPARIGSHVCEVDTPALLVELDALERNIRGMQDRIAGTKLRLRPHAKTHKSTAIANLQLAAAAEKFGAQIDVLIELDVGANRCGVGTPAEVVRLAAAIARSRSLRFAGLQAYHGSAQHLRAHADRRRAIAGAADEVSDALDLLRRNGLECGIVSGAGTGTFEFETASGVYEELQVGSYVFMDADYGRNQDRDGEPVSEFENSLFLLTTVMSTPTARSSTRVSRR